MGRLPVGGRPRRPGWVAILALAVAAALAGGLWTGYRTGRRPAAGAENAPAGPETVARALEGKVILIDPGHGGPDGGVVGVAGTPEKEITLAVAFRLRDLLALAGARPVLTREADTDLRDQGVPTEPTRRRQELMARVRLAEIHQAAVLLTIHANGFGRNTRWQGAQVFYDPRGRPEGERLARFLQEALREQTGTTRTHRPIRQLVLERSPVPAANVEVGFLSNAQEERRLRDPAYQDRLAHAILLGLARYLAEPAPAAQPPPPGSPSGNPPGLGPGPLPPASVPPGQSVPALPPQGPPAIAPPQQEPPSVAPSRQGPSAPAPAPTNPGPSAPPSPPAAL